MGKNDRCAIGACNNARMYEDKQVVKPHISAFDTSMKLRFWKCTNPNLYNKWTSACNRKDFKFGKHHVICSNHFEYGRPSDVSPTPTLYLKGYTECAKTKRKSPAKRCQLPVKKSKVVHSSPSKEVNEEVDNAFVDFDVSAIDTPDATSTTGPDLSSAACAESSLSLDVTSATPVSSSVVASTSTVSLLTYASSSPVNVTAIPKQPSSCRLHWGLVKNKSRIVKLYTGCSSAKIFDFIVDHVRTKHQKLKYYKGHDSITTNPKQYQVSPIKDLCQRKPGPSRILSLEDEILMTLMRIRLDCPVEDLAFRFGVSPSLATSIITTFIIFLSLELNPLIYWPTPEETEAYKHAHFKGTFNLCEGIGDCTEQYIQHSKNPDAQYQTYSTGPQHIEKINYLYQVWINIIYI